MEGRIKCELVNKNLWDLFDFYGNEMIITKVGRRIFPSIDIKFFNLDPKKYYGLFLDFSRVSSNRYKYSPKCGWTVGRPSDTPHVISIYQHPESPALGSHWMSKTAVFDKVLFSNNVEVTQNIIILSSMHKYLPQIHIHEISNSQRSNFHLIMNFPETSFVAVTAYQNSQITELKVQNNKYANGHRMKHDQDKTKRKERDSNTRENFRKKFHGDDIEEDSSSQDSDKPSDSYYECSLYCPFPCCNNFPPCMLPIRPEPMKPNFLTFDLLPYKFGYKEFNSQFVENLNNDEKHANDIKSYTDFTIRTLLNIV